jgi:hypothetical protein
MKYSHLIIFALFFLIGKLAYSQEKIQPTTRQNISPQFETKIYHYTFAGNLNAMSQQKLEADLLRQTYVVSAKIKYKAQSQKGELFLYTNEKVQTSEGDVLFDITSLKKVLIENGLQPEELNFSKQ